MDHPLASPTNAPAVLHLSYPSSDSDNEPDPDPTKKNVGQSDRWKIFAALAIAKYTAGEPLNSLDLSKDNFDKASEVLNDRDFIPEEFKVEHMPQRRYVKVMWRQFCQTGSMSKKEKGGRPLHHLRGFIQEVVDDDRRASGSGVARHFNNDISRQTVNRHLHKDGQNFFRIPRGQQLPENAPARRLRFADEFFWSCSRRKTFTREHNLD